MKRIKFVPICFLIAGIIAGCAPAVIVQNEMSFPVRAIVVSGGRRDVLSPSPGESSSAEASEGPYNVTVIPDEEWVAYAKGVRQYLNERLANADGLTGPQLLDVIRRLKEIATKMNEFERAAGSSSRCSGTITSDGGGAVVVSTGASGSLVVTCK